MILVLGKTGYVSKRFQDFFQYKNIEHQVISLRDLKNPYEFSSILSRCRPEFVLNCIGYTGNPNIESCEHHKEDCLYVNVSLQEIIAEACRKHDIALGYVSSGCIYEENKDSFWHEFTEEDVPNFSFPYKNCSWYSGTKALGESVVKKTWGKTYLWRLRMPFNHQDNDKNLIVKLLKYPKVWSYPNSISNLDEFVQSCYKSYVNNIPYGIYNMTNPGSISAKEILDIGKTHHITKPVYQYFRNLAEFNEVVTVTRSNCVLDTTKIGQQNLEMMNISDSIDWCFRYWKRNELFPFWD